MTTLEITFHYGLQADETALQALGRVRQVCGVRKAWLNERAKTIRVEYDASRLGQHDVAALLRSAGIRIACVIADLYLCERYRMRRQVPSRLYPAS